MHDAFDGGSDENGLIGEWHHFEFGRDVGQDSWQRSLHLVHDRQRGALPLRVMVMRTPRAPLVRTMFLLWLKAVANLGDILDVDCSAVDGFESGDC